MLLQFYSWGINIVIKASRFCNNKFSWEHYNESADLEGIKTTVASQLLLEQYFFG